MAEQEEWERKKVLFEFKETEPEVKNRAIGALFSILRWLYGKYDMTHPLWDLEMN